MPEGNAALRANVVVIGQRDVATEADDIVIRLRYFCRFFGRIVSARPLVRRSFVEQIQIVGVRSIFPIEKSLVDAITFHGKPDGKQGGAK